MKQTTKLLLRKWIQKVGEDEVVSRLKKAGIGTSTIDQMVNENYAHEPRGLNRRALFEELAKDGISPAGEVAS